MKYVLADSHQKKNNLLSRFVVCLHQKKYVILCHLTCHTGKKPSSKQESNELALFTTFYVEVDIWIICKKKGTFLSSLIPPCQFCPSSSLCPSSPSVLWTDSVSEFAAFATGNDINDHRNVAKKWRCFFGIYIFQFVWSLCCFFFFHCINCQLDAQGFSRLLATVKHSDAALYMLWDGRGVL